MRAIKKLHFFLIFISSTFVFSQDINKLIENNGFRKIKLNTNVYNYVDDNGEFDFIKKDSITIKYFRLGYDYDYVLHSDVYSKIGNVKIQRVFVKTLNDIIYEIIILTEPNFEIFDLLKLAYGKPTTSSNTYPPNSEYIGYLMNWTTEKIFLSVNGAELFNSFSIKFYDKELESIARKLKYKEKTEKAINEF